MIMMPHSSPSHRCSSQTRQTSGTPQGLKRSGAELATLTATQPRAANPATMMRAPNDGAGSFPANARMAGDLEVPRPLRLILTLTNTSGPHRSQGQDRWPSSGTPQAPATDTAHRHAARGARDKIEIL
jgi:hypothetical protein